MREIAALFWLLSFMLAPLHAAEPPPEAAADEAETKPTDEPAGAEADSEEAPAEPAANESSAADRKPSPQRFIPSEQVRADFDVSFPIDI